LRSLFPFFQWADRGSPPIVAMPDSRRHGLQLAGRHRWVAAVTTEVYRRTILERVQIELSRKCDMRIRLKYITPLLAAGAAAAAIAAAPAALAAPSAAANPQQAQENCIDLGTDSQCQSPGNVQLNDSPPYPDYPYYGVYPYYGYYGGYHGGYGDSHFGGGGHR
jgi:hypothetical protein